MAGQGRAASEGKDNKKRERLKQRFVSQGDVAKMDKAGVCKTPIAGSSPAVASTDIEPIAGRQNEAIGD